MARQTAAQRKATATVQPTGAETAPTTTGPVPVEDAPAPGPVEATPETFKLEKVSQHGIAYYTRPGFKAKWAIPSPHFNNAMPPAELALILPSPPFASAPVDVADMLKKASPEKMAKVLALLNGGD